MLAIRQCARDFDPRLLLMVAVRPFPTPIHGAPDMTNGIHYLLYDNFWNTNYVFWWPYGTDANQAHMLFRFGVELSS